MAAVAGAVVAVVILVVGMVVCLPSAAAAGSVQRRKAGHGGVRGVGGVTYDHRALVLNGTRRMLFSGEIHYPRSTPEVMCVRQPPPLF